MALASLPPGHYDALIISQRDQQERFTSETNSNLDTLESQSTLSTEKVPISTSRKPCRCGEKKIQIKSKSVKELQRQVQVHQRIRYLMSACSCCGWCQGKQCGGNQRLPRDKKCRTSRKRSKKIQAYRERKKIKTFTGRK